MLHRVERQDVPIEGVRPARFGPSGARGVDRDLGPERKPRASGRGL